MGYLLIPFSWLYGLAMILRNLAYDRGLLASWDAGVPVISVGNMTAGGTGKTPLVEYIAGHLLGRGVRVGVLSRGYRRRSRGLLVVSDGSKVLADAEQGGDEPVLLARRLHGASVVVAEHRAEGARKAVDDLGAQVLILDDGFQHRSLRRSANIVVVDGRYDVSREPMLPAGKRREPMTGMRRADLIAFSRGTPGAAQAAWQQEIAAKYDRPPIRYHYCPEAVCSVLDDQEISPERLRGAAVFAFSGIGDHKGFVQGLSALGADVCGSMQFGDHHRYNAQDMQVLKRKGKDAGAAFFLTTEKDAVKLRPLVQGFQVFYLRIGVEIDEGRDLLFGLIEGCLQGMKR